MRARAAATLLTYGLGAARHHGDVESAHGPRRHRRSTSSTPWGEATLRTPARRRFNASNLLGVLGVLLASDVPLDDARSPRWRTLTRAAGAHAASRRRRQAAGRRRLRAHARRAREGAGRAAPRRSAAGGELVCVFGCGGDRDPGKRPLMGARRRPRSPTASSSPATTRAARIPPRSPSPIAQGVRDAGNRRWTIALDRARGDRARDRAARPGDVVLVAGKGHETYQEIAGGERPPFTDAAQAARRARRMERRMMDTADGRARVSAAALVGGNVHVRARRPPTAATLARRRPLRRAARRALRRPRLRARRARARRRGARWSSDDRAADARRRADRRRRPARRARPRSPRTGARASRCRSWSSSGSNGKTTVKEMLAAILRDALSAPRRCSRRAGNLNNDIGLPLTLLRLRGAHRAAVIELGMNHRGEIAYLVGARAADRRARQQRAARAPGIHDERRGSRGRAGGCDRWRCRAGGIAVINADDPHATVWRDARRARRRARHDLRARRAAPTSAASCTLHGDRQRRSRSITPAGQCARDARACPGVHNARNALAAAAAALAAGAPLAAIAAGLARLPAGRGPPRRRRAAPGGATVIDDTYNANPGFDARGDRRARGIAGRSAGSCSATWARSAPRPGVPPRGRRLRARARASTRAVRARRTCRRRRSARSARARAHFDERRGARRGARARRCMRASRCSSRARASCAWSASVAALTGARGGGAALMLLQLAQWPRARTSARSTSSATSRCARCSRA